MLKNCTKNAYSLYWQPVYSFNVISFESKIIEKSQFLSYHYTRHLHEQWRRSIAFQRFRPAIYGITLHALVLDIYSLTSSPFLIQLILLDFHDVPSAVLNSRPCAGGVSQEIFSWLYGLVQPIGCHLSYFRICFDRSVPQSYDITDINSFSIFVSILGFALSFIRNRQHHIKIVIRQWTWFGV